MGHFKGTWVWEALKMKDFWFVCRYAGWSQGFMVFTRLIAVPFLSACWHIPVSPHHMPSTLCCSWFKYLQRSLGILKTYFPQSFLLKGCSSLGFPSFLMQFSDIVFHCPHLAQGNGPLLLSSSAACFLLILLVVTCVSCTRQSCWLWVLHHFSLSEL